MWNAGTISHNDFLLEHDAAFALKARRSAAAKRGWETRRNKERKGCIYLLRNLKNGRGYVGYAFSEKKRWSGHIRAAFEKNSQCLIHTAIRKYGAKNFSAEVVYRCPASELLLAEKKYIRKLKTYVDQGGYNLTWGGDGGSMAVSVRKRMSKAAIERAKRPGERELRSAAAKAQWKNPAFVAKFVKAVTGKEQSLATRKKRSHSLRLFWTAHPEARLRVSAQSKRRLASKAARKAHSERLKAVFQAARLRRKVAA